jgi:hypothetical protein
VHWMDQWYQQHPYCSAYDQPDPFLAFLAACISSRFVRAATCSRAPSFLCIRLAHSESSDFLVHVSGPQTRQIQRLCYPLRGAQSRHDSTRYAATSNRRHIAPSDHRPSGFRRYIEGAVGMRLFRGNKWSLAFDGLVMLEISEVALSIWRVTECWRSGQ